MQNMQKIAAAVIQGAIRGYLTRKQYKIQPKPSIAQVIKIQKYIRGVLVRLRIKKINKAATKIQSFYKSHLQRKQYSTSLSSILSIQSAIRKYLTRSKKISQNLSSFLSAELPLIKNLQTLEHSELFSIQKTEEPSDTQEVLRTLSAITESTANISNIQLLSTGSLALQLKQVSPFHLEKMYFFTRVFELEALVDSSVYEPFWAKQLEGLTKDLIQREEQILDISIGNCHSLALTSRGKVYAWGWNDKFQCAGPGTKPRVIEKDAKFIQVSCGNDHSLLLTTTGQVLSFGDNSKGQLGLGHYSEQKTPGFINIPPCRHIEASGNQNMAISAKNELFIWPFETVHGEKRSYPMRMLPDHLVSEVSLGFNFAVILTTSGLLYSLGSNNKNGQLGLGDCTPRSSPTLILYLKKIGEKMASISCGHRHVIARSTLGKIFTWGCGNEGQLGHGSNSDEIVPRLVGVKGVKPVQLAGGLASSMVMFENRKVMWTGKNSMFSSSVFIETNINARIPDLFKNNGEFAIVKIKSLWSRTVGLSLITVADLRYLHNVATSKLQTGLAMMAAKWTYRTVELPFIECISSYYHVNVGKKIKQGKGIEDLKEKINEILKKPEKKWSVEEKLALEHFRKVNN